MKYHVIADYLRVYETDDRQVAVAVACDYFAAEDVEHVGVRDAERNVSIFYLAR